MENSPNYFCISEKKVERVVLPYAVCFVVRLALIVFSIAFPIISSATSMQSTTMTGERAATILVFKKTVTLPLQYF